MRRRGAIARHACTHAYVHHTCWISRQVLQASMSKAMRRRSPLRLARWICQRGLGQCLHLGASIPMAACAQDLLKHELALDAGQERLQRSELRLHRRNGALRAQFHLVALGPTGALISCLSL
jgi:hypothetical protein